MTVRSTADARNSEHLLTDTPRTYQPDRMAKSGLRYRQEPRSAKEVDSTAKTESGGKAYPKGRPPEPPVQHVALRRCCPFSFFADILERPPGGLSPADNITPIGTLVCARFEKKATYVSRFYPGLHRGKHYRPELDFLQFVPFGPQCYAPAQKQAHILQCNTIDVEYVDIHIHVLSLDARRERSRNS